MESFLMNIPRDLKLAFKIKAIQEQKSMSEILIAFIKSYVGRQTRKTA